MERKVKIRGILRFYFSADSLERAFENLILRRACNPYRDGFETAEKICGLIDEKIELEKLWSYLNVILNSFSEEEKLRLRSYALRRRGEGGKDGRAENSAVVKFSRRARRLNGFEKSFEVLENYRCLLVTAQDRRNVL